MIDLTGLTQHEIKRLIIQAEAMIDLYPKHKRCTSCNELVLIDIIACNCGNREFEKISFDTTDVGQIAFLKRGNYDYETRIMIIDADRKKELVVYQFNDLSEITANHYWNDRMHKIKQDIDASRREIDTKRRNNSRNR